MDVVQKWLRQQPAWQRHAPTSPSLPNIPFSFVTDPTSYFWVWNGAFKELSDWGVTKQGVQLCCDPPCFSAARSLVRSCCILVPKGTLKCPLPGRTVDTGGVWGSSSPPYCQIPPSLSQQDPRAMGRNLLNPPTVAVT